MLTFFETLALKFRCSVNDTIETTSGEKFRCIGWGKDNIDGEYQDCYTYKQFNTEETPKEFKITNQTYCDYMNRKKIFKIIA